MTKIISNINRLDFTYIIDNTQWIQFTVSIEILRYQKDMIMCKLSKVVVVLLIPPHFLFYFGFPKLWLLLFFDKNTICKIRFEIYLLLLWWWWWCIFVFTFLLLFIFIRRFMCDLLNYVYTLYSLHTIVCL